MCSTRTGPESESEYSTAACGLFTVCSSGPVERMASGANTLSARRSRNGLPDAPSMAAESSV